MNFFLWLVLLSVAGTGFAQTTVLNGTSGNATSSSNFSTGTSGNSITLSQGFFAEYLIVGGDGNGRWAGDIGDSSGAGAERRGAAGAGIRKFDRPASDPA